VIYDGVDKVASSIGLPLLSRLSAGIEITVNHLRGIGSISISNPWISKEAWSDKFWPTSGRSIIDFTPSRVRVLAFPIPEFIRMWSKSSDDPRV